MNCKPGDLAVVVKTLCRPDKLGAFVRVLRPYDEHFGWGEPAWFVSLDGDEFHAPDSFLRPIRGPKEIQRQREGEMA